MGVRENKVETYLNAEIIKLGGMSRKWMSPGRDGVPDRICVVRGRVWFVEVKTIDGVLSPEQLREHDRLDECGAAVRTVYGKEGVDELIKQIKFCEIYS